MKKFVSLNKYFILTIFALSLFMGGFLIFSTSEENLNNSPQVYADEILEEFPEYFSRQYHASPSNDGNIVNNNNLVLTLTSEGYVQIRLSSLEDKNNANAEFLPLDISASIKVNGKLVELPIDKCSPIKSGQHAATSMMYQYFNARLSLHRDTTNVSGDSASDKELQENPYIRIPEEGKVEIVFNYYEQYGPGLAMSRPKTITFNFYFYENTTYFVGSSSDIPATNMLNTQEPIKLTNNVVYDFYYYYNYNQNTSSAAYLNLPQMTFNPKVYSIGIKRTFQGLAEEVLVRMDTTTNTPIIEKKNTNSDVVAIRTFNQNNSSKLTTEITFKDLGEYEISYYPIYYNEINSSSAYIEEITNIKLKQQKLINYGFQLYYTDINSGESKPFFSLNENNVLDKQTDVSFKKPIINYVDGTASSVTADFPTLQSTNQAPVQTKFNAKLSTNTSKIYKLDDTISNTTNIISSANYNGQSITEAGKYLIYVEYTYESYMNTAGGESPETKHSQWFLFELTSSTPKATIVKADGEIVNSRSFTNQNVTVKYDAAESIFNSEVLITVSQFSYNNTFINSTVLNSSNGNQKVCTADGNYEVEILYGKGLQKPIKHYFTIDTNNEFNITANNVEKTSSSTYNIVASREFSYFTNDSFAVSWNEKESGAKTSAYYYYIPLITSQEPLQGLVESMSIQNNWIPVAYKLDSFANSQKLNYDNTKQIQNLSGQNILSNSGLYIFVVKDSAGNSNQFGYLLDKTSPRFIVKKKTGDTYANLSLSVGNITASEDIMIYWGKNKAIEISQQLSEIQNSYPEQAKTINDFLENHKIETYGSKLYFIPEINQKVYYKQGNSYSVLETTIPYQKEILYKDDSGLANEFQYTFLIIDESNTKGNGKEDESLEKYLQYPSAGQIVVITSDSSKFQIYYGEINNVGFLRQNGYITVDQTNSKKDMYYNPTKQNLVKLSFVPQTESSTNTPLQIAEVKFTYYPFVSVDQDHYELSATPALEDEYIYLIDKNNPSQVLINLTSEVKEGTLGYDLYPELLSNKEKRTRQGKYIISRTYLSKENVDREDYFTRTFTIYVDRYNVITSPEIFNNDGSISSHSLVGGEIYLTMFDRTSKSIKFNNLYTSENIDPANIPVILTTNKLPIGVFIPQYKYVKKLNNGTLIEIDELTYFNTSDKAKSEITTYKLGVKIIYTPSTSGARAITYTGLGITNGYWNFVDSSGQLINNFKEAGGYTVCITQDVESAPSVEDSIQSTYYFQFQIDSAKPEFEVLDEKYNSLNLSNDNFYYTNKDKIKVQFTDPTNEYISKIDKNDITVTYNSYQITVPSQSITTSKNINEFTLDLKSIFNNAYVDGAIITITMHYEGSSQDYPANIYSSNKNVKIDLVAPTDNLNRLLAKNFAATNIDSSLLRQSFDANGNPGTSFNISTNNGNYAYYSFTTNISYINDIFSSVQAGNQKAYFKSFTINNKNTKYVENMTQETSYQNFNRDEFSLLTQDVIINLGTPTSAFLAGTYYEIVEEDLAGNLTIYTIYIAKNTGSDTAISYKNGYYKPDGTTDIEKEQKITFDSLKGKDSYEIYSRTIFTPTFFNLNSDVWYTLNLTQGTQVYSFLHTPYIKSNEVINLNTNKVINLDSMYAFKPNNTKYQLLISNRLDGNKFALNISVMQSKLSIIQTDTDKEYIAIDSPRDADINSTKAVIFAQSIKVYLKEDDLEHPSFYAYNPNGLLSGYQPISTNNKVEVNTMTLNTKFYVTFTVKTPVKDERYKYVIVDNYGETYTIIHDFQEIVISEPIKATKSFYSDFNIGNEEYYVTTGYFTYTYNTNKNYVKLYQQNDNDKWNLIADSKSQIPSPLITPANPSNPEYKNIYKITIGDINTVYSKYKLELFEESNNEQSEEAQSIGTLYFLIYNIYPNPNNSNAPKLVITDKNNDDITKPLLLQSSPDDIYSGPIKITYTDGADYLIPWKVSIQYEKEPEQEITSGSIIEKPGNYKLFIRYAEENGVLGDTVYYYPFSLADSLIVFYKVVADVDNDGIYEEISPTGKPFTNTDAEGNMNTIGTHYIVNTKEVSQVNIVTNKLQDITYNADSPIIYTNGTVTTYVYRISNYDSQKANISFYQSTIAISFIPTTSTLFSKSQPDFGYYSATGGQELFTKTSTVITATTNESNFSTLQIFFKAYYGIPENEIYPEIYKDGLIYTPTVQQKQSGDDVKNYITLSLSGEYQIKFRDKAGNVQLFTEGTILGSETDTYRLVYLNSVIILVNNSSPIKNAVYSEPVVIETPSPKEYYDASSYPIISVLRNGETYKGYTQNRYTYTFTEAGLYDVWFSAKSEEQSLREEHLIFTIIDKNESRIALEYSEYGDYYIKKIVKNEEDITRSLTDMISDNKVNIDGQSYLKSLLISQFDEKTGAGRYQVTIATRNEMQQTFTFSFWINTSKPPIIVSVPEGTDTTDKITVTYNAQNLYEALGNCYIKIGTNVVNIDETSLNEVSEISITTKGTHYIQIFSASDKLLYSYKVIKSDPLNATAIIIIVIAVLVAIGGTVLFILLRKRIKVK